MANLSEQGVRQGTAGESLNQPIEPVLDQTSDLQPIFSDCLDNVVEIVGSRPTSSIYLVDESQGELVLGMQRGVLETAEGRRGRTNLDESWMGLVARQGEIRFIDDLGTDPETSQWGFAPNVHSGQRRTHRPQIPGIRFGRGVGAGSFAGNTD